MEENKGCNKPQMFDGLAEETVNRIKGMVEKNKRFLFMKGQPEMPMCGFSARVVEVLRHYGKDFESFDILSDQEMRHGVKVFSNWPTFPQLYVDGQLVGGCDVIMEMHQDGELEEALGQN